MHVNCTYNGFLSVFIGWCLHVCIKENHPTETLYKNNLVVVQYVMHRLSITMRKQKLSKPAQIVSFIGI